MWSDQSIDHQICFLDLEKSDLLESNELIDDPTSVYLNKNPKKDSSNNLNKKILNKNQSSFSLNYDQSLKNSTFSFSPTNDYNQLLDQMICNYNYLNEFGLEKKKNVQTTKLSSNSVSSTTNFNNFLLKQTIETPKNLFDWNCLWTNSKEKQLSKFFS